MSPASWVAIPASSDFPVENLPYGIAFEIGLVVAIGDHALPLAALGDAGLLDGPAEMWASRSLNLFLAAGPSRWQATRTRLIDVLTDARHRAVVEPLLIDRSELVMLLPVEVGDYVDFYSSIHHATNLGRLFRPDSEPLLPNWRQLPVGYHGRAGTVVVSGSPIRRPRGLVTTAGRPAEHRPSSALDIELEVGTILGVGSDLGEPVPVERAGEHIFGFVLLNDWSARDIQSFEYQPLGPFLGKSFATTVAPWVVTVEALHARLVDGPTQEPAPSPHLRSVSPWGIDLELRVRLQSETMRRDDVDPVELSAVNFASMYWTADQQLAHLTSNGASTRPGDLFGSGTVSGPTPGSEGSLIELTRGGRQPLRLPDGSSRAYLEDGDTVTITGWSGGDAPERPRIGFGAAVGHILPALP